MKCKEAALLKRIIKRIKELSLKAKIQLSAAVLLTISLAIAIPVYAWFNNQKKAAEMFKIEYPNSLYLNAAHREDRIYFDLDELDMDEYFMGDDNTPLNYGTEAQPEYREKDHRLYAFSVSGEGTTSFTLQLAHTNNNELKYEIYEATQTPTKPETGYENFDWVHYERHIGDNSENPFTFLDDLGAAKDAYYIVESQINGQIKNPDDTNDVLAKKNTGDPYYIKTYGDTNDNVEVHAVPTYWQATIKLNKSDIDRNTKEFHKYYILKVSWKDNQENPDDNQENSKETDLIYLAVKRNS